VSAQISPSFTPVSTSSFRRGAQTPDEVLLFRQFAFFYCHSGLDPESRNIFEGATLAVALN
jgi:hypothetical protein